MRNIICTHTHCCAHAECAAVARTTTHFTLHPNTCLPVYARWFVCSCVCVCLFVCKCMPLQVRVHEYRNKNTHTRARARELTWILYCAVTKTQHTHTHTRARTHKLAWQCSVQRQTNAFSRATTTAPLDWSPLVLSGNGGSGGGGFATASHLTQTPLVSYEL